MAYKFVPYFAGGAGGGPCSWNDITDKPFYEEVSSLEPITWDGDINNRAYFTIDGANRACKVSDRILTANELLGSKVTKTVRDGSQEYVITENDLEYGQEFPGGFCIYSTVYVIYDAEAARESLQFVTEPSTGTYFWQDHLSGRWTVSITFPSDIKTLDEKFIPKHAHFWDDLTDKPFGEVLIYTCESNEEFTDYRVSAECLVEGDSYTVVFDGIPHKCVAKKYYDSLLLGNSALLQSDLIDTGEPFAIEQWIGETDIHGYLADGDTAEHSVQILAVKKIDPNFVPEHECSWNDLTDKPFGDVGPTTIVLNTDEPEFVWANDHPYVKVSDIVLSASDVIGVTVYFKGGRYDPVPVEVTAEEVIECDGGIIINKAPINLVISVSNTDAEAWFDNDTGNFTTFSVPEPGTYFMFSEGGETQSMTLPTVIKTIDEKFIPDTIARVSADLVSIDLSALDTEGKIVETFADGSTKTTTVEFDADGNPVKITDADGNETVLAW